MTIQVKVLNDVIKEISDTNTSLDMLLEFEKTLDDMDLYAYKNWQAGEVLAGPDIGRHWVTVKLLYKESEMPDPEGAKRLISRGCLVKFAKDELVSPVKVKTFDDVTVDMRPDGTVRHKAKTKTEPVWVVEVKMPRRFVDEFEKEVIETDKDNYVDTESLNAENTQEIEQATGGAI